MGGSIEAGDSEGTRRTARRRRRQGRAAVLVVAALLAVAGCAGGDDEATDGATSGGSDTTEAPEGTQPPATDEGTAASGEPRPSAGCASTTAEPVVEAERTLTVGDQARRYLLTVPSAHAAGEPVPVVLDFHGLMEGAEVHATMSQYSTLAEEEGFVAVFPHGTGEPLRWNPNPAAPNLDLDYTDAMLAALGDELCIDESRIYATGLSNGAMFTSLLLCERADVIAAAAPVAGITDITGCDPSRPVPILSYHGTEDPILLFNGGVNLSMIPGSAPEAGPTTTQPPADLDGPGYPANLAAFAERNGCDPEPTDTEVSDEVVHRVYDCPDGADVEMYIVVGGGHSWPGSDFSKSIGDIVGPTTFDIDATRDSWTFLRQFQLP